MDFRKSMNKTEPIRAESEIELVNAYAKTNLTEDEVYMFSVLLCDNEIDRDFEKFTEKSLEELRELFVGVTGISDHRWETGGQKARIYRTELIHDSVRTNTVGEGYVYLRAYVYMLRTETNADLISEIEGGIKKEVSVGCSISESLCSICGADRSKTSCSHQIGTYYGDELCYIELSGAVDAYEWSFVAVPAQRNAGVIKRFYKPDEHNEKQFELLQKEASLGRRYMTELRKEVLRLSLLVDKNMYTAFENSTKHMDDTELEALKLSFNESLAEKFPPSTQILGKREVTQFIGNEYKV